MHQKNRISRHYFLPLISEDRVRLQMDWWSKIESGCRRMRLLFVAPADHAFEFLGHALLALYPCAHLKAGMDTGHALALSPTFIGEHLAYHAERLHSSGDTSR